MSDAKAKDQGEQLNRQQAEKPALVSPEAQQARNATSDQIESFNAANPDRSDGSATPKNRAASLQALIEQQDKSIELFDGEQIIAARVIERSRPAATVKETVEQQSKTIEELTEIAKHNPVFQPILGLRQHAEKLPPGEEKDRFIRLAKEQATDTRAQFLQADSQSDDQESCGSHVFESPLKGHLSYPEQEIAGVRQLTPQDLKMIARAFEAGPEAAKESLRQTSEEIVRRTGEASRDTLLAGIKAVWTVLEYDRDLLFNPAEARKKAAEAGEAAAVLLVAGVQLTAGGIGYADRARQTGDYSLPLKNISEGLNRWYEKQSPADQMAIAAELGSGFGLASGAVEANKLRKPGALMAFLKEGLDALPRNPEAERRAIHAISNLFRRAEPLADTGVGVAVKASDVVKDAHDKGIGGHIMEMVQFFPERGSEILTDRKLRQQYGLTKKEMLTKTEAELAALRIERIEASYKTAFFRAHPELKGLDLAIHHALPQSLRDKYPGLFKAKEVHSEKYLSGIPRTATHNGKWVHDLITSSWEKFKYENATATRQQVMEHMHKLDEEYGRYFIPPLKKGER
jgi:hypothetical protein